MAAGLTACVLARGERASLASLLPGVVAAADDVVVVVAGAGDGGAALARSLGARVVATPRAEHLARARNLGLDEVRTSHAVWLDAADRVTPNDLAAMREFALARPERALELIYVEERDDPDEVASCWQIRVVPARPWHRFEGRVHAELRPSVARAGTGIARLPVAVRHVGRRDPAARSREARRNLPLLASEALERPRDAAVRFHLAQALAELGRIDDACRAAGRCLALGGAGADVEGAAAVLRGRLELERGRTLEAERVLREAVARRPDDARARFLRAEARIRAGDLEEARRELAAARAAPILWTSIPTPVAGLAHAIRLRLGRVLEWLERPAEAAAAYREILRRRPGDPAAAAGLARVIAGHLVMPQGGTAADLDRYSKPAAGAPARSACATARRSSSSVRIELPILTGTRHPDASQVR